MRILATIQKSEDGIVYCVEVHGLQVPGGYMRTLMNAAQLKQIIDMTPLLEMPLIDWKTLFVLLPHVRGDIDPKPLKMEKDELKLLMHISGIMWGAEAFDPAIWTRNEGMEATIDDGGHFVTKPIKR